LEKLGKRQEAGKIEQLGDLSALNHFGNMMTGW